MVEAMGAVEVVLMQAVAVVLVAKEVVIVAVRVGLGMLLAMSVVGAAVRYKDTVVVAILPPYYCRPSWHPYLPQLL